MERRELKGVGRSKKELEVKSFVAAKVCLSHSSATSSDFRKGFQASRPKAYQLACEK